MNDNSATRAAPAATTNMVHGMLWMVFSCAAMAGIAAIARHLASEMHPYMIMFFRLLTAQICMLPWLFHRGIGVLKTERLGLYAIRALFTCGAMLTWFFAVAQVPIADVVAVSFVTPIFATVGAALVLRETVRLRRWTATAIGFVGVMIILRPGLVELSAGHWAALASAVFGSFTVLIIKSLSRTEDPTKVVFYVGLFLLPVSAVLAATQWETPARHLWVWVALIGPVATIAHVTLVKAMSLADASAILPFDFARLPFAALLGWLAFGELSDLWTWVGALVIFGSGVYIGRREAVLGRRVRPAAQPGVQ